MEMSHAQTTQSEVLCHSWLCLVVALIEQVLVLAAGEALPVDSLSVPVVDLVDVPKDNLVLSFHVVRDALLLDPLHVALRWEAESSVPHRSPALSHV